MSDIRRLFTGSLKTAPVTTTEKKAGSTIPNHIHLIWFGSWPPPDHPEYVKNITSWRILNPGYTVKLWTSLSRLDEEARKKMQQFCHENNIQLADVDDASYQHYPNMSAVKDWLDLEAIGKPRFAAASDVLRVAALEKEGGHYFDCDITPLETISDIDWNCPEGSYQLIDEHDKLIGARVLDHYEYCVMGAVPNNELYKIANNIYSNAHKKIMDALKASIESGEYLDFVKCAMESTGLVLEYASTVAKQKPKLELRGDYRYGEYHVSSLSSLSQSEEIEYDELYIKYKNNTLYYVSQTPGGIDIGGTIKGPELDEIKKKNPAFSSDLNSLKLSLPDILNITFKRGHTHGTSKMIVEGYLSGKVNIEFDRSYGRALKSKTRETEKFLVELTKIYNSPVVTPCASENSAAASSSSYSAPTHKKDELLEEALPLLKEHYTSAERPLTESEALLLRIEELQVRINKLEANRKDDEARELSDLKSELFDLKTKYKNLAIASYRASEATATQMLMSAFLDPVIPELNNLSAALSKILPKNHSGLTEPKVMILSDMCEKINYILSLNDDAEKIKKIISLEKEISRYATNNTNTKSPLFGVTTKNVNQFLERLKTIIPSKEKLKEMDNMLNLISENRRLDP